MDQANRQIMRYLAASVLRKPAFRQQIRAMVEAERRAFAPEIDTDLETLARLSALLEQRERRYRYGFLIILLAAVVLAIFQPLLGAFVLVVGGWALQLHQVCDEQYNLTPFVRADTLNLAGLEQYLRRQYSIPAELKLPDRQQNLVVYSGFSPFVGVGFPLGGWSFPVTINQPKEEMGRVFEIIPFKLADLYAVVEQDLAACQFFEFTARDLLFVNGKQIRDKRWILPAIHASPVAQVEAQCLADHVESFDPVVRYYKWLYMHDGGHEITVSYFVRFSLTGANLFVEANRFLLTPLADSYRDIDAEPPPTLTSLISLGLNSLMQGPFVALLSPLSMVGYLLEALAKLDPFGSRKRQQEKEVERNPAYDYGAKTSLREQVSGPEYRHYFQLLDKEMYVKVFEKQILIALRMFLDAHHIDTSDIKERQTTILNNGVIVQGGEMKAEALAVGAGAQAAIRSN